MDICCVCQEEFGLLDAEQKMVELECHHQLCYSCLLLMFKEQEATNTHSPPIVMCPLCYKAIRGEYKARAEQVSFINQKALQSSPLLSEFDINCIPCAKMDGEESFYFNYVSREFLCAGCALEGDDEEAHACLFTIDEALERNYISAEGIQPYDLCKTHPKEFKSHYCEWCKIILCRFCAKDDHLESCGHIPTPITELLEKRYQQAKELELDLDGREAGLDKCLEKSKEAKLKIIRDATTQKKIVTERFMEMTNVLNAARDCVLSEIELHQIADTKNLERRIDDSNFLLKKLFLMRRLLSEPPVANESQELVRVDDLIKAAKSDVSVYENNFIEPEFYQSFKSGVSLGQVEAFKILVKGMTSAPAEVIDPRRCYLSTPRKTEASGVEYSFFVCLVNDNSDHAVITEPIPLKISIKGKNRDHDIHTEKVNGNKGRVKVTFRCEIEDTVTVSVFYKGVHIDGSPFVQKFFDRKKKRDLRRYDDTGFFRFGRSESNARVMGNWTSSVTFLSDEKRIATTNLIENTIVIYNLLGCRIKGFGGPGTQDGCFNRPIYITQYEKKLYVSDQGNKRVQIFTEDGEWLKTIGGGLEAPQGICVTKDGMIIVADGVNCNIQWYNSSGQFVNSFAGTMEHPIFQPTCVGLLEGRLLVVADKVTQRILAYDLNEMVFAWETNERSITGDYFKVVDEKYIFVPRNDHVEIFNEHGELETAALRNLITPGDIDVLDCGRMVICEQTRFVISR